MHLPTWDELIDEQKDVLDTPIGSPLFVVGPPGSGKTVLAVARAQMIAQDGRSVALITYNRMLRRLFSLLTPEQASTMHSFVWHDFIRRTGARPPRNDSFVYDWDSLLTTLATHRNADPNLDHLVIDEGQDLAAGFFRYANAHAASALNVFADDDQSLGDRRTTLEEIKRAAGLGNPIILRENHRNTPEIAALAEQFHVGRLPAASVRRGSISERPRLVHSASLSASCQRIATTFRNRGDRVGVVVHNTATGAAAHNLLRQSLPGKRVDVYSGRLRNENSIALLEPGITVLNKESVKGQEFDTVFVLELEHFVPCLSDAMKRVMYMLCARARNHLTLVFGPNPLSADALAALPVRLVERM